MIYAIEMYFDKKTEKKIMDLAEKVADNGLSTKEALIKSSAHIAQSDFQAGCTK